MSIKEHPPQPHSAKQYELHVPVLLQASLRLLAPRPGDRYLDLTAGYGGHAQAFLEQTQNYTGACLVDRDEFAIRTLAPLAEQGARLMHTDFASAAERLASAGERYDVIVVDLGVSSPQLDHDARGFSFMQAGPLDMRMDRRQARTAEQVVNTYSRAELVRIITQYGEEQPRFAARIAAAIQAHRPITSTTQLAGIILDQHHGRWQKTHPATRTFQALRIEVNQELRQVEQLLPHLPHLLRPGGRVGIISFHSLEDRLVKRFLKEQAHAGFEAELALLNKKPLSGATEDVHNPRARSAKLRAAVKK